MKRVNVPVPEDLYKELKLIAEQYHSNITGLVRSAIKHALKHKITVWGFTKKDKEI